VVPAQAQAPGWEQGWAWVQEPARVQARAQESTPEAELVQPQAEQVLARESAQEQEQVLAREPPQGGFQWRGNPLQRLAHLSRSVRFRNNPQVRNKTMLR